MYSTYAGAAAAVTDGELPSERPPPRCQQCSQVYLYNNLNCNIHYYCKECFRTKTKQEGLEEMYMCRANGCLSLGESYDELPIYIFVDNSNIWIGAKKLGSKMKNFKSPEDHRVRIDYKLLMEHVANGRNVDPEGCKIYMSEPPEIERVKTKIEESGWSIEVLLKSTFTGKEKEVDSTIIKDIVVLAKIPVIKQSTIVLISGDRDMRPAVEHILQKATGWKVEIWMWEEGIYIPRPERTEGKV